MSRPKVTKVQAPDAPSTPLDLGLALLRDARTPEALTVALDALPTAGGARVRQAIRDKYTGYAEQSAKSDPGCFQRVLLLKAWRAWATVEDVEVLESALWTFEFLPPGPSEVAADLRAAALVNLYQLDEQLAAFHAVRLLDDPYTSEMSGQPAVTAARLLAEQKQTLPLYERALRGEGQADVLAECLRGLWELPLSLALRLLDRYRKTTNEIVLLGLFDLLLAHPQRTAFTPFLREFLHETKLIDVYRFLVTSIVASRDGGLVTLLREEAQSQVSAAKVAILREALRLDEPSGPRSHRRPTRSSA